MHYRFLQPPQSNFKGRILLHKDSSHLGCTESGRAAEKKSLILADSDGTKSPKSEMLTQGQHDARPNFARSSPMRSWKIVKTQVSKDKDSKHHRLVKVYQSSSCSSLRFLICSSKNTTLAICSSQVFASAQGSSCFCSTLGLCSLSCRISEACKIRKHHDLDLLCSDGNLWRCTRQSGDSSKTWLVILWLNYCNSSPSKTCVSPFSCMESSCV